MYNHIKDIPYPFLHDAVLLMDKYTEGVKRVRITNKGECCIVLKGKIEDKTTLQRILMDLDPNVTSESSLSDYSPKRWDNYDWSWHGEDETYIYSQENIDYRRL